MSGIGNWNSLHESTQAFITNLTINSAIFLVVLFAFSFLRRVRLNKGILNFERYFNSRCFAQKRDVPRIEKEVWAFQWIWDAISYDKTKMLYTHGCDSAVYLTYIRSCLYFTLLVALISNSVILPINVMGTNKDLDKLDENFTEGMNILTIANIADKSSAFYVHFVMTVLYSLLIYAFAVHWWKSYLYYRKHWHGIREARTFTVMITDIPKQYRSERIFRQWLNYHYGSVEEVEMVPATLKRISKSLKQRQKMINRLEKACSRFLRKGKVPTQREGRWSQLPSCFYFAFRCAACLRGPSINRIEDLALRIKVIEQEIEELQARARTEASTHVAFVTLSSVIPVRSMQFPYLEGSDMAIYPATAPVDVYWEHLGVTRANQNFRSWALRIFWMGLFLALAPTFVFISALSDLRALSETRGFRWVENVVEFLPTVVVGVIEGVVPGLLVTLIIVLIHPVVRIATILFQGLWRRSDCILTIIATKYAFLFFDVLFVSVLTSLLIGDQFAELLDQPSIFIEIVGEQIPALSLQFLTYITTLAVGRVVLQLFRFGDLLLRTFAVLRAGTARTREQAHNSTQVSISNTISVDAFVFTICLIFSVISPIVTLFALLYFVIGYVVYTYNMLYANVPRHEGGGSIAPLLFHLSMVATTSFQIVMLGILGPQMPLTPSIVLAVLPIVTLIVWFVLYFEYAYRAYYGAFASVKNLLPPAPSEFKGAFCSRYMKSYDYFNDEDEGEEKFRNYPYDPSLLYLDEVIESQSFLSNATSKVKRKFKRDLDERVTTPPEVPTLEEEMKVYPKPNLTAREIEHMSSSSKKTSTEAPPPHQ